MAYGADRHALPDAVENGRGAGAGCVQLGARTHALARVPASLKPLLLSTDHWSWRFLTLMAMGSDICRPRASCVARQALEDDGGGRTDVISGGLLTASYSATTDRESDLKRAAKLDAFLADVEKRAFRMAAYAVGDPEEALDITQDAMMRLAQRYADRPEGEWPALFHRILQNRIRDHQRRRGVRQRVIASGLAVGRDGDAPPDPVDSAPDLAPDVLPDRLLELEDVAQALHEAVTRLPTRQQQTFLLRTWEGLDVAQTARAMGCSEGSVKTHYSRAVRALRARLETHYR